MKTLCIVNPRNVSQVRPMQNFHQGCQGDIQDITWFENNKSEVLNYDVVVFQGIIRGSGHLMQFLEHHNKKYVYIDHAYFFPGYNPVSEWMRASCNGFMPKSYRVRPRDRWQQYFNTIKPKAWRGPGEHILVLPPSTGVKWCWPESALWLDKTVSTIKQYTARPIVIREKPDQLVFDPQGNILGKTPKSNTNLEADMARAHCVIAYNSNSLTTAVLQGLAVIGSPVSPAYHVSQKFEDLENITEPDTEAWLNYMAYNQFNTTEFRSGLAWQILQQSL